MRHELRVLFRKEAKQLLRSRAALWTSLGMPALVLVFAPISQFFAVGARHNLFTSSLPKTMPLPRGLVSAVASDLAAMRWVFAIFVALGGLLVPAITAVHTVVSERDNRTLELLAALPVRLTHVLLAKFGTILLFCIATSSVLLGADSFVLISRGFASASYMLSMFILLVSAMAYSASTSLVTTLIAKDFRTANNINGMFIAPFIVVCVAVMMLVPGEIPHVLALSALLLLAAGTALFVAIKIVSFERLLQ